MKSLYWVQLLTFAVLVISSTAQAQNKAAVCQSNVEQLRESRGSDGRPRGVAKK